MDIEEIRKILTRYGFLLDKEIKHIEKLKNKAVFIDFPDGVDMGEMVIELHRREKEKVEEALKWLETVRIVPKTEVKYDPAIRGFYVPGVGVPKNDDSA